MSTNLKAVCQVCKKGFRGIKTQCSICKANYHYACLVHVPGLIIGPNNTVKCCIKPVQKINNNKLDKKRSVNPTATQNVKKQLALSKAILDEKYTKIMDKMNNYKSCSTSTTRILQDKSLNVLLDFKTNSVAGNKNEINYLFIKNLLRQTSILQNLLEEQLANKLCLTDNDNSVICKYCRRMLYGDCVECLVCKTRFHIKCIMQMPGLTILSEKLVICCNAKLIKQQSWEEANALKHIKARDKRTSLPLQKRGDFVLSSGTKWMILKKEMQTHLMVHNLTEPNMNIENLKKSEKEQDIKKVPSIDLDKISDEKLVTIIPSPSRRKTIDDMLKKQICYNLNDKIVQCAAQCKNKLRRVSYNDFSQNTVRPSVPTTSSDPTEIISKSLIQSTKEAQQNTSKVKIQELNSDTIDISAQVKADTEEHEFNTTKSETLEKSQYHQAWYIENFQSHKSTTCTVCRLNGLDICNCDDVNYFSDNCVCRDLNHKSTCTFKSVTEKATTRVLKDSETVSSAEIEVQTSSHAIPSTTSDKSGLKISFQVAEPNMKDSEYLQSFNYDDYILKNPVANYLSLFTTTRFTECDEDFDETENN